MTLGPNLRILCLHGYHGSGAILRRQMEPLVDAIPSNIELLYPDTPTLSSGDFGWWHEGFRGWDRTREWAFDFFRNDPDIDGIFGFSQGAALAGLLSAVRESGPSPLSFDFSIMVGGFTSTMSQHASLFGHKLTIPSIHVVGRADRIVPMQDSLTLADRFTDPIILEHSGGHIVPGSKAVATPITEFLAHFSHAASNRTRTE